jgi:hypothetical protein
MKSSSFSGLVMVCLALSLFTCSAQSRFSDNLEATGYYHFGYVLPEYSNFIYIVNKPTQGVTLNFSKRTRGKNDWEKIYNYPSYGISLFYSTLGNNKIHGSEIAIVPYFHADIISRKKFNFFNETGFGLGYVTKIFDAEDNYLNIAVGSHLNLHFNLKFGVSYKLTEKFRVNGGLSFDHFSNANSKNPNLGINWVTAFAGVGYAIGNVTNQIEGGTKPHVKGFGYEAIVSFGGKRPRGVLQSDLYYTTSFTFEGKWRMSRAIHLGVGGDVFHDPSAKIEMEAVNKTNYHKSNDFRTGIHLSQEFIYSRLSLILQEGIYIGLTDSVNGNIMYNRGIVRVGINDHLFVQLAMKSHLNILDYPELGLGMKW